MYLHTKFYEARTLSSIWLKNYLSQMEENRSQQLIQGTVRQETWTQENCITVERENYLGHRRWKRGG